VLSFLASPKPFVGHAGVIQRNAIRSWKAVNPDVEVIIYGDGEGVSEVCRDMGLQHVPDIPCSPSGVPYFNEIARHADRNARYDTQCYLNCDIILAGDIIGAIRSITFPRYLITGQRIDMQEGVTIDVTTEEWRRNLPEIVMAGGAVLHAPTGMDYFIFERGTWSSLLPLVIGRGGYDEALVLYCLRNGIPFINGTLAIVALHQYHDYGHLKGGRKAVGQGEDARNNRNLHRNHHSMPNSADAPWLIIDGKLVENTIQRGVLRKIEHYVRFSLGLERISLFFRILWRLAAAVGIARERLISIESIMEMAVQKHGANR
jgi:hypothetical protein